MSVYVFVVLYFQMCTLDAIKESNHFVCGDRLLDEAAENHDETMVVRQAVTCTASVETAYYSATTVHFEDCCFYCGGFNNLLNDEYMADLRQQFSHIHPLCALCKAGGKQAKTWGQNFLQAKKARLH